jgi:hypothetical protein
VEGAMGGVFGWVFGITCRTIERPGHRQRSRKIARHRQRSRKQPNGRRQAYLADFAKMAATGCPRTSADEVGRLEIGPN